MFTAMIVQRVQNYATEGSSINGRCEIKLFFVLFLIRIRSLYSVWPTDYVLSHTTLTAYDLLSDMVF